MSTTNAQNIILITPEPDRKVSYRENWTIKGEEWYVNGKQHRIDGPGEIWYYENGVVGYKNGMLTINNIE
jgi:hypothetical protein